MGTGTGTSTNKLPVHIAVNCLLHQKTGRPSGRTVMLSSDLGNHGRLLNYWVTNMLAYL